MYLVHHYSLGHYIGRGHFPPGNSEKSYLSHVNKPLLFLSHDVTVPSTSAATGTMSFQENPILRDFY